MKDLDLIRLLASPQLNAEGLMWGVSYANQPITDRNQTYESANIFVYM